MANNILSVGFNQDFGCFACGLDNGFLVFNADPLKKCYEEKLAGAVVAVEMLFRCNYVAIVGGSHMPAFPSNSVVMWDVVCHKEVLRLEMKEEVKAVRLRRDRIVVVLYESVEVFRCVVRHVIIWHNCPELHQEPNDSLTFTSSPTSLHVYQSCKNPVGLCCLCPSSDNSLLVFPAAYSLGSVSCVNLNEIEAIPRVLAAHMSQIAALALNSTGTQLATASEKGTIIRIFDTSALIPLKELRRGTNPAIIYCLNFSSDSSLLCVSSNHRTIHLFSLKEEKCKKSTLRKLSLSGEPSFAKFRLPFSPQKDEVCVCSFGPQADSVIAVSSDGNYCKFNYEPSKGGCIRQTCSLYLETKD